jgi:hypothetical protein
LQKSQAFLLGQSEEIGNYCKNDDQSCNDQSCSNMGDGFLFFHDL